MVAKPGSNPFCNQQTTLQERANKEAARRADTEARFADAWRQLQAERDALAAARVRSYFTAIRQSFASSNDI